jgi:Transposase IS116/IS110/IS902 family
MTRTAKGHAGQPFAPLQSVPGRGQLLALVLLSDIQALARFPRGQACVSYGRLVKCATEANGKWLGTSGKKSGTGHLRWAVAEAALLC